ncbi:hypothetical protein KCU92_g81, partial [Aureobasidium melanogenum]
MARSSSRILLSAGSAAEAGRQCLTKAGPLAHVSNLAAILIFFILVFLCFCISLYLIMLVKGVPDLDAPKLHQRPVDPAGALADDPTPYVPMPGSWFAKACKGGACLALIVLLHLVMFLCIRNMRYCSMGKSLRVYLTQPNVFTVLEVASLWWHTISATCCVNLVIAARVLGEDQSRRIEMDLTAVPVLTLSWMFYLLTAPIHLARRILMHD